MQEENQIIDTKTIYVKLLDEGIDVYRPVKAFRLKNDFYQIIDDDKKAYEDAFEEWEFKQGDIVSCMEKPLSEGIKKKEPTLIAVKKVGTVNNFQ